MKLCILTDIHFGIKNDDEKYLTQYQLPILNKILQYCCDNNITTIIHLGDLFNSRKKIDIRTWKTIKTNFFDILKKHHINFITITGNHDLYYTSDSSVSSYSILEEYNNIKIINTIETIKFDNCSFCFVPWLSNEQEKKEFLQTINTTSFNILAGHFDIQDFEITKGIISTNGFNKQIFSNIELVLSGHYHTKQQQENILYLGTQYELNWNDYNQQKGYYVFDTINHSIEFNELDTELHMKILYTDDFYNSINDDYFYKFNNKPLIIRIIVQQCSNEKQLQDFISKLEQTKVWEINIIDNTTYHTILKNIEYNNDNQNLIEIIKEYLVITKQYNDTLFKIISKIYLESQEI
jgi:DNA repair exonuclease SbcCD nuclease subunit